jgi:hypothetical protein
MNLNDKVLEVVQQFVQSNTLFTALDVSNEVKNALPHARHREVRDLVRSLVSTTIDAAGYGNTQINVKLPDGSSTVAVLYHPLSDSWDLDAKYDASKREQSSVKPAQVQPVVVPVQAQAVVASVVAAQTQPVAVTVPVVKAAPPVQTPARVLWDNLFKSQPSLFPRK